MSSSSNKTASPLKQHLIRLIKAQGPLPLSVYMAEALGHPEYGYYRSRDPLGEQGDFTTAPEISQMFGELIGLWFGTVWQMMESPQPVHLVELGPGRGTLMADALRALKLLPNMKDNTQVHFVETSPTLRDVQLQTVAILIMIIHLLISTHEGL